MRVFRNLMRVLMKFTQTLISEVKNKWKRPSVVAALMGFPSTGKEATHVGSVMNGKRPLPVEWAARWAEIVDMDPDGARITVENERRARPGYSPSSDIQKALAAYPLSQSRSIGSWAAKGRE